MADKCEVHAGWQRVVEVRHDLNLACEQAEGTLGGPLREGDEAGEGAADLIMMDIGKEMVNRE